MQPLHLKIWFDFFFTQMSYVKSLIHNPVVKAITFLYSNTGWD